MERQQRFGSLSVLALVQAVAGYQTDACAMRLLVASNHAQFVGPTDPIAVATGPLLGLLKTAGQEFPWLDCRHVDLPVENLDVNASRLLTELGTADRDGEIAYRDGQRLVCRLERADPTRDDERPLPFRQGGVYLITGGLGGLGVRISRFLLERYQAKLLLLGRRRLEEPTNGVDMVELAALEERRAAHRTLTTLGGDITYAAVDVSNGKALAQAVAQATKRWGQALDGVIHLAGDFAQRLLSEETPSTFLASLRAKVVGTWALHQLTKEQPDCFFLNFSSVNGFLGGYGVGAYAAANAFLDGFAQYRRHQCGLPSTTLAWSLWDEVGMSQGYALKALSRSGGFYTISADQGLTSFLSALHGADAHLLIGLDETRSRIQRLLDGPVEGRLAVHAYCVSGEEVDPSSVAALAIRDRVGRPSTCTIVPVAELPRSASGEIDFDRLSTTARRATLEEQGELTELERQIADVWRDILGPSHLGKTANFFALGGNSLLAAQVIGRLRQTYAVDITPRAFFDAPTVTTLADQIEQLRAGGERAALPPLPKVDRQSTLPLSLPQRRLWFLDQVAPGNVSYNVPIALRLRGDLDVAALEESLREIVRRHEVLRTTFRATDGEPYQVIVSDPAVTVSVLDLPEDADGAGAAEVSRLARQEAQQPFVLTEAPLLRARLLRLAADHHILLLTVHHIVFDGWSVGVFRRELAALYDAFSR
ncbi:MAG TPA: SDR family NAD(P)-dependent oxidoreductase, partial [Chloroflexota bacterium]|nr:SDR family NAD(P)-dependent oxidoreductase [Chloroflexota bacterium]